MAAKKKAEPKKPAPAAPKKKDASATAAPATPLIDTNLAANAAAAMVAGKFSGGGGAAAAGAQPAGKKESAAFKQLKAGLNKPASGALGGAFNAGGQQGKKSNQPYTGPKQVGHNQTYGADVNRTGVPRRTSG